MSSRLNLFSACVVSCLKFLIVASLILAPSALLSQSVLGKSLSGSFTTQQGMHLISDWSAWNMDRITGPSWPARALKETG